MLQPFINALVPFLPGMIELPEAYGARVYALTKGKSHRYIRRVPKSGGGYRYFYHVGHGGGVANTDHFVEGAAFQHEGGHFHITKTDGDKLTIRHDETGETKTVTKAALRDMLSAHHGEAIKAHREKAHADLADARKAGASAKQIARLEARAKAAGPSTPARRELSDREQSWVDHVRGLAAKHNRAASGRQLRRKDAALATFYAWTADHAEGKFPHPPKEGHRPGTRVTGPSSYEPAAIPDDDALSGEDFREAQKVIAKLGDPAKFKTSAELSDAHMARTEARQARERQQRADALKKEREELAYREKAMNVRRRDYN